MKGCGKADQQNNANTSPSGVRDQDSKRSPSSSPSNSRVLQRTSSPSGMKAER